MSLAVLLELHEGSDIENFRRHRHKNLLRQIQPLATCTACT